MNCNKSETLYQICVHKITLLANYIICILIFLGYILQFIVNFFNKR